jgi:protein-tyrosine phosphatase
MAGKNDRVTWLELDGAVNVRDLGGLPAADGRQVVAGRLLRGDDLNDLSPADVTLLVSQIGLTTVIDLRSPREVQARGPGPLTRAGLVRHRHHSLLPELGMTAAADAMTVRVDRAQARYPGDVRCGLYLGYLEERPAQVVSALRDIARASGPALVHCAAGKDRTGVIVALALSAAAVRRDAVVADYAATAERIGPLLARMRGAPAYVAGVTGQPDSEHVPRAETMAAFLDQVDARYGGARSFLSGHGFAAADAAMLTSRLLQA